MLIKYLSVKLAAQNMNSLLTLWTHISVIAFCSRLTHVRISFYARATPTHNIYVVLGNGRTLYENKAAETKYTSQYSVIVTVLFL